MSHASFGLRMKRRVIYVSKFTIDIVATNINIQCQISRPFFMSVYFPSSSFAGIVGRVRVSFKDNAMALQVEYELSLGAQLQM